MLDIQSYADKAIVKAEEEGVFEKAVEKAVHEAVEKEIKAAFDWSSDFRESLKESIKEKLHFDPTSMDFTLYNQMVAAAVNTKLNNFFNEELENSIKECMDNLIALPPKEVRLSEVVKAFIHNSLRTDEKDEHDHITLIVDRERSSSFCYIYIDEDEGKSKYNCDLQFSIYKDELIRLPFGDKDVKDKLFAGPFYGVEKLLFQAYVCKSKFIIDDIDECDLYSPEREEDCF